MSETNETGEQQNGQGGEPPQVPPKARIAPTEKANVRLSASKKPRGVDTDLVIGQNRIKLPSEEQQRAGFFVKDPSLIVFQYPGEYKYYDSTERLSEQLKPTQGQSNQETGESGQTLEERGSENNAAKTE